jgi:histone arginine demethylase JMJD6
VRKLQTKQSEQYKSLVLSSSSKSNEKTGTSMKSKPENVNHLIASNTPLPIQLDARTLTTEAFRFDYDAQNIPCIIHNIPKGFDNATFQQEWPANHHWTFDQFNQIGQPKKSNSLRECAFKCGEDDDGKSIKVKLKYFLRYIQENKDDSPLYIFDSNFDEKGSYCSKLLHDYSVPSYFQNDLFGYISKSRRPPYRWILIGPQRSGSCIHTDPLATHAWNTLIVGQKRWVLFPPHVSKEIVKGKELIGPN